MPTPAPEPHQDKDHTKAKPIRVHPLMWEAYGRVCDEALGTDRTKDLTAHMRAQIKKHGTTEDRAKLAQADAELAERRARKGGRPPKARAEP